MSTPNTFASAKTAHTATRAIDFLSDRCDPVFMAQFSREDVTLTPESGSGDPGTLGEITGAPGEACNFLNIISLPQWLTLHV